MAIINLIPSLKKGRLAPLAKKTDKSAPGAGGQGAARNYLPDISLGIAIALSIILFVFLGFILMQVKMKEGELSGLDKKTSELKSVYKITDELTQRKKGLEETAAVYAKVMSGNTAWSKKLTQTMALLPEHIWLTNMSVQTEVIKIQQPKAAPAKKEAGKTRARAKPVKQEKPKSVTVRTLAIKGSSTSLVEAEIMLSVTQFLENLKNDPSFSADFDEIKLGPVTTVKKGNFNIMSFSIFCRFK